MNTQRKVIDWEFIPEKKWILIGDSNNEDYLNIPARIYRSSHSQGDTFARLKR